MVTIAHLVEKIIEERPFIQEALAKEIINHAALAQQMMPEIEKELKKKVKFSAVNMAIRRLSEKLEKTFVSKAKFGKDSDITVKSNLIEITLYGNDDTRKYLKQLYNIVDFKKGDFLTITQGVYEIMIITNSKYEKEVLNLFPKRHVKKVIRNLSSLTINIPPEAAHTVGLFYIVTRSLNWENINIVDIVSTFTEMTFIVNEDDAPKALSVLKRLLNENK